MVATLWARAKVESLMNSDLAGIQSGSPDPAIKEQIVGLGINYRLMTQFTSFVAVEELTITRDGVTRTVAVPVEMPEVVSYEGVFGDKGRMGRLLSSASMRTVQSSTTRSGSSRCSLSHSGVTSVSIVGSVCGVESAHAAASTNAAVRMKGLCMLS